MSNRFTAFFPGRVLAFTHAHTYYTCRPTYTGARTHTHTCSTTQKNPGRRKSMVRVCEAGWLAGCSVQRKAHLSRARNFLYSINIIPPPASDKQFSPDAQYPPDKGIGRHADKSRSAIVYIFAILRGTRAANNCATCHCSHAHPHIVADIHRCVCVVLI